MVNLLLLKHEMPNTSHGTASLQAAFALANGDEPSHCWDPLEVTPSARSAAMTSAATATPQPHTGAIVPIHGRFVWHELLARDIAKATAFYPDICGWTVASMPFPGSEGTYTMFKLGDAGQAGVTTFMADTVAGDAQAVWIPYMATDDADATCREAVVLGATLHMPPTDIPTIGRIAMLADPEGAHFAVITPAQPGMPEKEPVAGEFAWHEMLATDPAAAWEFYSRLFGWEKTHAMDMGADGIYQMFGRGAFTYGGFMRRSPTNPRTMWNCYVRTADLDAACKSIAQRGGRIVMGPHEVPNDDRIVCAVDDQGAVFSLVSKVTR